jgi:hypothetical protein
MTPGFYSYKIDLQCAYISIGVKLSQYHAWNKISGYMLYWRNIHGRYQVDDGGNHCRFYVTYVDLGYWNIKRLSIRAISGFFSIDLWELCSLFSGLTHLKRYSQNRGFQYLWLNYKVFRTDWYILLLKLMP